MNIDYIARVMYVYLPDIIFSIHTTLFRHHGISGLETKGLKDHVLEHHALIWAWLKFSKKKKRENVPMLNTNGASEESSEEHSAKRIATAASGRHGDHDAAVLCSVNQSRGACGCVETICSSMLSCKYYV